MALAVKLDRSDVSGAPVFGALDFVGRHQRMCNNSFGYRADDEAGGVARGTTAKKSQRGFEQTPCLSLLEANRS